MAQQSASSLFRSAQAEVPTGPAREDRSQPVANISTAFAEVFNETQIRAGRPTAPVDEMAAVLEDYAVKAVRAEMLALAKSLTAAAKVLTAEDIRVLANVSGSSVGMAVRVTSGDEGSARNGGDRSSASSSVRFSPDPRGTIGKALRDLRVSPRALAKPAETPAK